MYMEKRVKFTKKQFLTLLNICQTSPIEISGRIDLEEKSYYYALKEIHFDESNMINNSSNEEIDYNDLNYFLNISNDIRCSTQNVYVRFHTHPGENGACSPSQADCETIKRVTNFTQKLKRVNSNEKPLFLECIITNKSVGFYLYDIEEDKIYRLPAFVGHKEIIPNISKEEKPEHKSLFERMGFRQK